MNQSSGKFEKNTKSNGGANTRANSGQSVNRINYSGKSGAVNSPQGSQRNNNQHKTPVHKARENAPATSSMRVPTGPTVIARDIQKWDRVQAQLKARLGPDSFASWFGRCRLESVSKSQLTLSVPTSFLKSWIRTHYRALLLELWQKQSEDLLRIDIVVRSAVRAANPEAGHTSPTGHMAEVGASAGSNSQLSATAICTGVAPGSAAALTGPSGSASTLPGTGINLSQNVDAQVGFSGSPLDPKYTFANFVEGNSNRMACAAAKSVAESDGTTPRFNPLFIHASVGLGKTHLLQAIAWAANQRNPNTKFLYLTAEYFMWRFASAIRDQSALSFKESLRDIDLLLIDDMQFLQGKSIQQEFCHLLNALIDSAKQVVVAADRPPSMLESLDDRVKSRLKGGVALEVKSPDRDMRRAMLELRYGDAQKEDTQLDIPGEILEFVARKVSSSGRDLEGAFNQLLIQHRFSEGPLDIEAVEKMLGHLVQSGDQKRVRIEDIQKVVARHYNVTKNDLLSNRRTRAIVRPRQVAMYLSKVMTPRSLPEIGRRFGGRDHTTVLHAVRKVETMLTEDTKLTHETELLKRLIQEMGQ